MRDRTKGFTLIELVVVLAIFSLVALVGVQVIRTTVVADRRLAEVSASSSELAVALALLRRDLRAVIGVSFSTPSGGSEPPLRIGQDGFALSVSGLGGVAGSDAGLGRVVWRRDPITGQLQRQVWTTLSPGSAQAAGPEVMVLSGVNGITVESFDFADGWQPGFVADPRTPNGLPRALRVRLEHGVHGVLETLVALQ